MIRQCDLTKTQHEIQNIKHEIPKTKSNSSPRIPNDCYLNTPQYLISETKEGLKFSICYDEPIN